MRIRTYGGVRGLSYNSPYSIKYREIMTDLINWKNKDRRKPLLLSGVRQCGKTYIIEKFVQDNFKNYVYINFEKSERIAEIFDFDLDVKRIITRKGAIFLAFRQHRRSRFSL